MDETTGKKGLAPGWTIALVTAMFVVPILVAWWMASNGTAVGTGALVNRGHLLQPPMDIRHNPVMAPLTTIGLGPGEWSMLYFSQGKCETACERALHMLDTIRSVLGFDGTRVQVASLLDAGDSGTRPNTLIDPGARDALSAAIGAGTGIARPDRGVVLFDWRGQVVMFFDNVDAPADIKKDLKRLLRGSKIK